MGLERHSTRNAGAVWGFLVLWIYYPNNGESNEQDKEHEMEMKWKVGLYRDCVRTLGA